MKKNLSRSFLEKKESITIIEQLPYLDVLFGCASPKVTKTCACTQQIYQVKYILIHRWTHKTSNAEFNENVFDIALPSFIIGLWIDYRISTAVQIGQTKLCPNTTRL